MRNRLVNTKRKQISVYMLLLLFLPLIGCGPNENVEAMAETSVFSEEDNRLLYVTKTDLKTEFTDPVYVDLSEIKEAFVIEEGGEYVLSGSYDQTLTVDVHDQNVHLFFNNLNIETAIGPAIHIVSGGKVVITLMDGSTNTFFDAAYYNDEDLNAAISAACDLTVNGTGTLNVCGYYKDAIHTKDVFKLLGGQVQLKSKRYGIKGNDGIVLSPDSLLIESEKNGCQTTNADKEGKGIIDIRGGEISIIAGEYGLSSVDGVYIREGQVYLNSVIADIYAEGQQYIAEGTIVDE